MNTENTPAMQAHRRHMETLTSVPRSAAQVREYIEEVRRTDGAYYAKWLRDEYAKWKAGQV